MDCNKLGTSDSNSDFNQYRVRIRKTAYVFDDDLAQASDLIPNVNSRAGMVHHLIQAYKLIQEMTWIKPRLATTQEILSFHSQAYLDFLVDSSNNIDDESDEVFTGEKAYLALEYGLGYDCPALNDVHGFMKKIAGGTLTAAEALMSGEYQNAINWCGGWHHAQRDEASGFCYVNDIVIGIQHLQRRFKKILYVDLDAHHGDGVENAFSYSSKVMTLSLHNFEIGYFPGTGEISAVGSGKGKYYAVNVPLKSGVTDEHYLKVFTQVFQVVTEVFPMEAIVVQCGADCLAGDKLGTFNLTEVGLGKCVQQILQSNLPTLFLGGGGYNLINTAKCWAYLTSIICGQTLSNDIPDHQFFTQYGPDFDLQITPTLRKNENTEESITKIISEVTGNLRKLHQI